MQTSFNQMVSNSSVREYFVEVVTFDGVSENFTIEASSEEDAQKIAAEMVDNADYVMIQGCY